MGKQGFRLRVTDPETAGVVAAMLALSARIPALDKLPDGKAARLENDLRTAIRKALDGKR